MSRVPEARAAWLARHVLPHEPALRAWLSRRALAGLEPDDVVHEAYARLAGLESVEHIDNARTYLFQVAKSVILMHMRRARILPMEAVEEFETLQLPSPEPSPERIASDRQELRRVQTILSKLPKRVREVFLLRKVDGLSQREIAARLGISESTVEKHIGKGLRILMEAMKDGGKPEPRASNVVDLENDPGDGEPRNKRFH